MRSSWSMLRFQRTHWSSHALESSWGEAFSRGVALDLNVRRTFLQIFFFFPLFIIINNAAMNIWVQVFMWTYVFSCLSVKLLSHTVTTLTFFF